MRISDWSSAVCSSVLVPISDEVFEDQVERAVFADTLTAQIAEASGRDIEDLFVNGDTAAADAYLPLQQGWFELGRASCRERGCQYVSISVAAVTVKHKKIPATNVNRKNTAKIQ